MIGKPMECLLASKLASDGDKHYVFPSSRYPENQGRSLNVNFYKLANSTSNSFKSAPGFSRRMIQIFPGHVSCDQSCLIDST